MPSIAETINGLDVENPGSWPIWVKALSMVVAFVVTVIAGHFLILGGMKQELDSVAYTESDLMADFETKAFQSANLEQYRQQMTEMESSFGALLRQLPSDTEVPGLLEDISHTGLGSGLTFSSIALGAEDSREFYSELPINIEVSGNYHAFGNFVSGVAALPRIVTLHDFTISPTAKDAQARASGADVSEQGALNMVITAKTYRYNDRVE